MGFNFNWKNYLDSPCRFTPFHCHFLSSKYNPFFFQRSHFTIQCTKSSFLSDFTTFFSHYPKRNEFYRCQKQYIMLKSEKIQTLKSSLKFNNNQLIKHSHNSHFPYEELHSSVYLGMDVLSADFIGNNDNLFSEISHIDQQLMMHSSNEDPHVLFKEEIQNLEFDLAKNIDSISSEISSVVKYLITKPSKKFRPILNFLLNKLLEDLSSNIDHVTSKKVYAAQRKIIGVTEMIHIASVMHDDVLDDAKIRRGCKSTHEFFDKKLAILGGDFLLARACWITGSLGSTEAFQRISIIVESLVKGEVIKVGFRKGKLEEAFKLYLTKTYYKTAALMAESCACCALLGGYDGDLMKICFEIGCAVGMSFQIFDDLLDFISDEKSLGKPVLNDLKSGLLTAPVLFALIDFPDELGRILSEGKNNDNYIDEVLACVEKSMALPRTHLTIMLYLKKAVELIKSLFLFSGNDLSTFDSSIYARSFVTLLAMTFTRKMNTLLLEN